MMMMMIVRRKAFNKIYTAITGFFEQVKIFGPCHEKTCLQGIVNNIGVYQPVHPCSLISAFVIPLLESILSKFSPCEISLF